MNYKSFIATMAALTLVWGCSSSDDDNGKPTFNNQTVPSTFQASPNPHWAVDMTDTQEPPQWTAPDPAMYENKMIVLLRLQEELVPFSTDADLMAVFVDDECRALSQRSGTASKVYFVFNIHSRNTYVTEKYKICYYSGGLKQLFVLEGEDTFRNEMNVGFDTEFAPALINGSTKYPVKTAFTVNLSSIDSTEIEKSEGDRVAVFVGDECRGVGNPEAPFTVFGYKQNEQGEVYYYSQNQGGIFTATQPITLAGDTLTYKLEYEIEQ